MLLGEGRSDTFLCTDEGKTIQMREIKRKNEQFGFYYLNDN